MIRKEDRGTVAIVLACVVWLTVATWAVGYSGRIALHKAQVAECERGKIRQTATGMSWRAQAVADQAIADDPDQPQNTRDARGVAAAQHRITASWLEKDSKIVCADAFPKPALLF